MKEVFPIQTGTKFMRLDYIIIVLIIFGKVVPNLLSLLSSPKVVSGKWDNLVIPVSMYCNVQVNAWSLGNMKGAS